MNKTLSVNIGGIVFHIEELAYDKLSRYLEAIKGYFTTSDGRDEIIQDIEGRIGEMFQERITTGKQVIVETDVEQVINIMGRPEQFAGMHEENETAVPPSASERRSFRRLYRDTDDRLIGGVCSGLGHYLGLDPVWFRVAFAIAFFVFGSGLLLYILLMLVMPKANTTAEKLEMKGEQVNISNIRRSVQGDVQGATTGIARFFDALGQILTGAIKLVGKIFAGIFVIAGVFILIAFLLMMLGVLGVGGISVPFFITDLFLTPGQQTMVLLSAFLVVGIPIILILLKSLNVLFKTRMENRFVNWSALALWIAGVVMAGVVTSSIAKGFRVRETQRTDIPLVQPVSDTLYLDVTASDKDRDEWFYINNDHVDDPWESAAFGDTVRIGNVQLDIIRSTSENFELVQVATSRGADRREAVANARDMIYQVNQTDSLLRFEESYLLPKGSKFRNQKLQLLLKVPEGKAVFLAYDMEDVIYDIKNVTNTYDGDMLGKTWTMTAKGLECIGCGLPDNNFGHAYEDKDVSIRIDKSGVRVRGIDDKDDTTYNFEGKDVDINIDESGVRIDTK